MIGLRFDERLFPVCRTCFTIHGSRPGPSKPLPNKPRPQRPRSTFHIGLMRCFSLQTCLSFISYYADVAEFVLRVQPTGMPRSNAPIQHQVQPQDDTCPRKAYQHRNTTTACLQPRRNRGRARPFWPTHLLRAVWRSSRRDGHCAWRGGGRRITTRVTCAARTSSVFPGATAVAALDHEKARRHASFGMR